MKKFKNYLPENNSEEPAVETKIESVIPHSVETPRQPTAKVPDMESAESVDAMVATLEDLREQTNALRAEKARMVESEEQLRFKVEKEIEAQKHGIEGLKAEIPALKQRCEKFAALLQIPVC